MKSKGIFVFDFKWIDFLVVIITLVVGSDVYPNQESLKIHPTKKEWQEFHRGFSELTDKDREILKAQMDILKERSKSDD